MTKALQQIVSIILILLLSSRVSGQHKKIPLKDSADGRFDMSNYIIEANGFIPVPYIITEKALGGFGVVLAPVFIKKKPPYIDSVKGKLKITPVVPDITGAAAGYTANHSWFAGAFRSATFIKSRIKYIAGAAYGDINMSFYKTIPEMGEKAFGFDVKTSGLMLQSTKRIGYSNWYAGLKYLFTKTDLKYAGDSLPSFVKPKEYGSIVSQLGGIVEFDNRDNIFTPDNGVKIHVDALRSDNIFGSDYEFWRLNYYSYLYKSVLKNLTGGLRIDGQQSLGEPPFYMLPYINMRGIPIFRYQGEATILAELEARWDFTERWSVVMFSGAGKAFDAWSDFGESKTEFGYGTGFRYLVARKFKLRAGIDIAKGPDTWTYYIVFGSNWIK